MLVTSAFLFGYVWTWYTALKAAPASLVTPVLTLAAIITIALATVLEGTTTTVPQWGAILVMAFGTLMFLMLPIQRRLRVAEAQ